MQVKSFAHDPLDRLQPEIGIMGGIVQHGDGGGDIGPDNRVGAIQTSPGEGPGLRQNMR